MVDKYIRGLKKANQLFLANQTGIWHSSLQWTSQIASKDKSRL